VSSPSATTLSWSRRQSALPPLWRAEAFAATSESAATASLATAEEGIEVLQAYSKEVSRRLPEFTKSRAAVEESVKEEDSLERDGRGAGTVGYSSRRRPQWRRCLGHATLGCSSRGATHTTATSDHHLGPPAPPRRATGTRAAEKRRRAGAGGGEARAKTEKRAMIHNHCTTCALNLGSARNEDVKWSPKWICRWRRFLCEQCNFEPHFEI
jgi:hypothetical protein